MRLGGSGRNGNSSFNFGAGCGWWRNYGGASSYRVQPILSPWAPTGSYINSQFSVSWIGLEDKVEQRHFAHYGIGLFLLG